MAIAVRRRRSPVRAAIAVIERNGRYLVSQRRPRSHLGGHWEFPGGKRRRGESSQACLRRELREELGIVPVITHRLAPLRFAYPDRRVVLEVFRCRIGSGRPQALGSQRLRWVTPAQLAQLTLPPANRPLIHTLAKRHLRLRTSR